MQFYMAPMEGLTGYVFRNAYQKNFGDVDKYFTPFIANKKMNSKEIKDILPEHNRGMYVVPQILTGHAEDFLAIAKELQQYGYETVNLNLGCPSGTVVAKHRGAGFLAVPNELDSFLEEIFENCPLKISIKTRIGIESSEEWETLQRIYEKYPMEELIIHPRVQKDFYKNTPKENIFFQTARKTKQTLCYNGDIFSKADYENFCTRAKEYGIPLLERMMLGRGIIKNPGLIGEIKGRAPIGKKQQKAFHDDILHGYLDGMSGERNTLFRMKELWFYMGESIPDSEKYIKQMKKTQRIAEYEAIAAMLFLNRE